MGRDDDRRRDDDGRSGRDDDGRRREVRAVRKLPNVAASPAPLPATWTSRCRRDVQGHLGGVGVAGGALQASRPPRNTPRTTSKPTASNLARPAEVALYRNQTLLPRVAEPQVTGSPPSVEAPALVRVTGRRRDRLRERARVVADGGERRGAGAPLRVERALPGVEVAVAAADLEQVLLAGRVRSARSASRRRCPRGRWSRACRRRSPPAPARCRTRSACRSSSPSSSRTSGRRCRGTRTSAWTPPRARPCRSGRCPSSSWARRPRRRRRVVW